MKKLPLIVVLLVACIALASCHLSKPKDNITSQETVDNSPLDSVKVDALLLELQHKLYELSMVNNDVVTNVDAIINIEERISKIRKTLDENSEVMSDEQQQRYLELREEYKNTTGF